MGTTAAGLFARPILEHAIFLAVLVVACAVTWRLARPDQQGSTAVLDFSSRFGKHHVFMPLGTIDERDANIKRHIEDFIALQKAVEAIP